jgi:hypothetical protein
MLKKFVSIGIGVTLALGILVVGCGEQTPEVKIETASPQNLVCKGIVYGNYWLEAGSSWHAHSIGPVSSAMVTLVGSYETKSAVTNADGEYVFEKVKYGNYVIEVTKEGYQRGEGYLEIGEMLMYGSANASSVKASNVPDGAIFTVDLDMGINPVMRSVLPLPNSTIETDAVFTITFNKPIDTATVRPSFVSAGVRTFAAGDTVSVSTAWSGNDTVLTVTPLSPLLPNEVYHFYLGPNEFADVKDKEGYRLASSTSPSYGIPVTEQGNVIENNDYFTYYTASGGAPGAPSDLMVSIYSGMADYIFTSEATGVNYWHLTETASNINLYCDPPSSGGPITGYRFYAAIEPASVSDFVLLGSTVNNYYSRTVAELITALYGSGSTVDPLSTQNYPFINKAVYFKAVTYNGDGESTQEASTGALKELVPPLLDVNAWDGNGSFITGYVLDNNYYLPAIGTDTTKAYVFFNEAIDVSTVTTGAFSITANGAAPPRTILSVNLLVNSRDLLRITGPTPLGASYAVVEIIADGDITQINVTDNYTINAVAGGVKDLAGNVVAAGGTSTNPLP